MAQNIVNHLIKERNNFFTIETKFRSISNTNIPFFDIEYRTVLKIIFKNFDKDLKEIPSNKEYFILNKNIHIFERLFGFKFKENKSVSAITNQSFIGLEIIYPEIKEVDRNDMIDADISNPVQIGSSDLYLEKQQQKKSFHVFNEPSTIMNDGQAFVVKLLD